MTPHERDIAQEHGTRRLGNLATSRGPARLETFADGVFAIAATLLILNVDARSGAGDLDRLTHIWPSYLAYAVSFVTIGIMWVNHHTVMSQIDRTDRRFLFANIGLLLCIAFVPVPDPPRRRAHPRRRRPRRRAGLRLHDGRDGDHVQRHLVLREPAASGCCARRRPRGRQRHHPQLPARPVDLPRATLVAFLSPAASVILFLAIAVFYVLESSLFGNPLERGEQRVDDARVELRAAARAQLRDRVLARAAPCGTSGRSSSRCRRRSRRRSGPAAGSARRRARPG